MAKKPSEYIIGIDFGTTNCTMAFTKKSNATAQPPLIEQFAITQLCEAGQCREEPSLPSFIYFPLAEELQQGAATLPWQSSRDYCVGLWARQRGEELSHRTIASAKSWLCHAGIDRRAKLLPLADEEGALMSPLEACAALLTHLREAWDYKMGAAAPFAQQEVLVTVPASFDPAARQLVEEAAAAAGYPPVLLLEEPQAAFYAWLQRHPDGWRDSLAVGDTVLVVDVGGGTTDFSTIAVTSHNGDLQLERKAVGAHLLLGGDNIDLFTALLVQDSLGDKGAALDSGQQRSLIHSSRRAKEALLGADAPAEVAVTVQSRGRKLVGGTLKASLQGDAYQEQLLSTFLPLVEPHDQALPERRSGLQEVGLPYAQDGRLTSQLAKFLSMTGEGQQGNTADFVIPTAILFNGGTMKAGPLRERLLEQVLYWGRCLGRQGSTVELQGADYDFAVSRGAVYYGCARDGKAIRIKASTAKSYFIGVEEAAPAIPGRAPRLRAVCVVPHGMEEGSEETLSTQQFALVVGEKATFRFFSHGAASLKDGTVPVIGTVVTDWREQLTELPPVEALLQRGDDDGKVVRVLLHARVTELGTLELWCQAPDGRRWKLEFDLRAGEPQLAAG